LACHQPQHRQGVHARGRVLVLRTVRGPLPDRRGNREHAVPAAMTDVMDVPPVTAWQHLSCDVAVVGGGTAGTMAAITAAEHGASVLLIEKAHVRHSGALAMGMDGVNNAVIPGKASPEDYVTEITRANDGVVNQRTIHQTATRGFDMVRRLERYGVK